MKKSLFGIYHPAHKAALLCADLAIIAFAFSIASYFRLATLPNFTSIEYVGLSIIICVCLFLGNGYTSGILGRAPKLPLNTFFVILASSLPCTLFIYFLGPERFTALFGRGVFPVAIVLLGVFGVLSRYALNLAFRDNTKRRRALVLGTIKSQHHFDGSIKAMHLNLEARHIQALTVDYNTADIDLVVITPDHKLSTSEQEALIACRLKGIPIFSLPDFFESFSFLVPVQEINNDWLIRTQGFTMLHSSVVLRVKRVFDILFAMVLLLCTLPIMLLTALLIKLTSKGPVLFSQTRVGLKGDEFVLYKFRTMTIDAEKNGEKWATTDDPRIIPIGGFLRKSRIDELPQCWNILKGQMSIVGPRPERPNFTQKLSRKIPYYELRHVVKPGLTGWAQVCYPYGASTEDALRKLQYDLYYIKNYSLILDFNILLRTVLVTLARQGR